MKINNIKNADSYKVSHFTFMEEGTTKTYSYIEARGGGLYPKTVFFGIQYYLREYLCKPITPENIDTMARRMAAHGEPFNRAGWEYILNHHEGRLPLIIRALPEGIITPLGTVLVVVENTDPECAWLTSYIETALIRAVWYPTSVATQSYEMKQEIRKALELSGDVSLLPFKLVDFGARGAAVTESAALGGAANLLNFQATDNILGIDLALE
jgi:nicotinamide phosphoribosyltransferase